MKNQDDLTLWRAFCNGDKKAFASLFMKYHPILLQYGQHLCQDEKIAEDCIQNLFYYLFERRNSLKGIKHFKGYLLTSFRRRIILQNKRREKIRAFSDPAQGRKADTSRESQWILKELQVERRQALSDGLMKLPLRQREAIHLKYFSGLDAAEIKQVMGISHQGVLNTLHKAMKNLRLLVAETHNSNS